MNEKLTCYLIGIITCLVLSILPCAFFNAIYVDLHESYMEEVKEKEQAQAHNQTLLDGIKSKDIRITELEKQLAEQPQ